MHDDDAWNNHWVLLARLDEVPEEGALEVQTRGRDLALLRQGEYLCALADVCTGCGARLSHRTDSLGHLRCACDAIYDPRSGAETRGGPSLTIYPVMVVDNEIYAHMPAEVTP